MSQQIAKQIRVFENVLREGEGPFLYRHDELLKGIEEWTSRILSATTVKNPKIGISTEFNFRYFCILYACLNVGANLVILDAAHKHGSKHDPFLPLDLIIYDYILSQDPHAINYWSKNATVVLDCDKLPDFTVHSADPVDLNKFTMISATTSGTTATPKVVPHTYEYMLKCSERALKIFNFSGRIAHVKILHHGSTLPVFFLPSVLSDASNFHYCAPYPANPMGMGGWSPEGIADVLDASYTRWMEYLDINHMLLPYTEIVEDILKSINRLDAYFTDLTLYTLSYIRPEWAELIRGRNIRVISIFGCTEASGPVLLSHLGNDNVDTFNNAVFYAVDDFFTITPVSNGTRIQNDYVDVVMGDLFEPLGNNRYKHLGRSDICRINDVQINVAEVLALVEKLGIKGQLVIDTQMEKIYLALWGKDLDVTKTSYIINKKLLSMYSHVVKVSKTAIMDKDYYMSGIKLNMELLRHDFRNNV